MNKYTKNFPDIKAIEKDLSKNYQMDIDAGKQEGMKSATQRISQILDKNVIQLKADLGIAPYSDVEQPEKYVGMSEKEAEENINDFIDATKAQISNSSYIKHNKVIDAVTDGMGIKMVYSDAWDKTADTRRGKDR